MKMIFEKFKPLYFICGLLSLVFGFIGQMLLEADKPGQAAVFFVFGVVLTVVAFRKLPGPTARISDYHSVTNGVWTQWGYYSGGLAIILAGIAFWLFTREDMPAMVPWLLHLASMGLFLLAILWLDGGKRSENEDRQSWTWLQISLLVAILGLAAFLRIYQLDQLPFGTWYDEADDGLNALRILNEPGFLPVFSESTRLPAYLDYLIAFSFQLMGVSTVAVRAVSVAFGVATVAVAYMTGQELFNSRRAGLIVAFLMAVSRWDINWSRIGMHGVSVPFFELLSMGLILRALRRQRLLDYALAGLAVGVGLGFYVSFRLFPLVIAIFLLVVWLTKRDFVRTTWQGLLVLGLAVFISSVPVTQFILTEPDAFFGRMKDISIFNGRTVEEGWTAISRTTQEHLLMFNVKGDRNGRHNLAGEPMLDPISAALMVLGFGFCVWRFRQPGSFLLVAWLLFMLVPGIFALDFESPQTYRTIGSLPAACLLIAVPLQAIWQEWERLTPRYPTAMFVMPLVFVLGVLGWINVDIYFNRQSQSVETWAVFSTPETITGKIMATMDGPVDFYISTFFYNSPTIRFLAPQVTEYHRLETYESLPFSLDSNKSMVIIIDPERKLLFEQAKTYYPNGTFNEIKAPNGQVFLYEIVIKPEDIAATQGLIASYYRDANWTEPPFLVRTEENLGFDWRDGSPAVFPLGVEWQGVLFAPKYGSYRFQLKSPAPVELYLDDMQVTFNMGSTVTAEVLLAQGRHAFRLRTTAKEGRFELEWQPPSEKLGPIPASAFLLPPITNNGLLGRYYANGNWNGVPAFTKVDPWIRFYFHNTPLPRPYTVEWVGKIKIPVDGRYKFGLESIDESLLWIDEKQIINNDKHNQLVETALNLTAGMHTIRLQFGDRTGSTHVNLYWQTPDGELEIIPQEVLFLN